MENIKFSIIIPAYNSEKYIEKCLYSILNQTYKNIEIIVVDDCSLDNTTELVRNIDSNIKLFSTQINSRQGAARNIGLENATGDYILFVDADDWIENNEIVKKIADKIKDNNNPDIIYLGMKIIGKRELEIIPDEQNTKKGYRLGENKYINVVSTCWKRELLTKNSIKFPEKIRYEDVFFSFLAIERAKSFSYINDIYYIYNNREDSSTTDYSLDQAKDTIMLIDKLFELYDIIDDENKKYLDERINQQYERAVVRLERAIKDKQKKRAN